MWMAFPKWLRYEIRNSGIDFSLGAYKMVALKMPVYGGRQCQHGTARQGTLHGAKWHGKTTHGEINREITVMADEQEDKTIYKVVLNHEEQYSIWPAHRENALGWKDAGKSGTKAECLAYIKEVWTDMRPLSLRKKMQEQGLS
jgi:MbtH protein